MNCSALRFFFSERRRVAGLITLTLFAWLFTATSGLQGAESAPLPAPQTIKIFGAALSYYDVGQGPAIVLVHGLGSSAKGDWGSVIMPLATHHRVLALDLLGFGSSDKPFIDYSIQTWVDLLGEFLREKHVSDFCLVGESLGGWISAQYAIQAFGTMPPIGSSFSLPKPNRLVLSDAAGHRALAEKMLIPGGKGMTLAGEKALLGLVFHNPSYQTDDAVRNGFAWSMGKGDTWTIHSITSNRGILTEVIDDQLGAISVPTLVVWGQYDLLVPIEDGRDYAAKIPHSQFALIANSGHAPMIELPDAFLKVLETFLKN